MAEPVCPYCRMPFDEAAPPQVFCTACGTPHHEDCYQENGGCTVFGCKCAPADEPKLQLSQSDLSAVSMPAQPYAPVQQASAPAATHYPRSPYGGPLGLGAAAAPAQASATAPAYPPQAQVYQTAPAVVYGRSYKSRTAYIVLGIFLGGLGVHNFYAGYTGRAVGQLCLTVLTLGYLAIVSWLWAIIEVCIMEKDGAGINFS